MDPSYKTIIPTCVIKRLRDISLRFTCLSVFWYFIHVRRMAGIFLFKKVNKNK